MPSQRDNRPPMVVAMMWVHRLTTISIEMVLPAVLGYWADERWGTGPWLVLAGTILGFTIAIMHLVRIGARANEKK